jgi:prolyl-tRNA synthetase
MFADMELIGIPHRVVVGEKNLDRGMVEYKHRRDTGSRDIRREEIVDFLRNQARTGQADNGEP